MLELARRSLSTLSFGIPRIPPGSGWEGGVCGEGGVVEGGVCGEGAGCMYHCWGCSVRDNRNGVRR